MKPNHSEYLTFSRKIDRFTAEAAESTQAGITFLRLELARVRPGMSDYLIRVATPVSHGESKSNQVITLRANRKQATFAGAQGTARVIIKEMQKRKDTSVNWTSIDADHLAKMIAPTLKFFSTNTGTEKVEFSTEALT